MTTTTELKVSEMAESLIGSEIIKIAAEISERIRKGDKIYNLTIGDFSPSVFPIPAELTEEIIRAYREGNTNYPPANGMQELREAVSGFIAERQGLHYPAGQVLIGAGARPLIYALFQTLLDPGDKVVFPVPSWNNNHYCHLSRATAVMVQARPENNFMPVADDIRPHLKGATMLALCSPLNPTGTTFSKSALEEICDLVLEENLRRGENEKPLYIFYDQIYWALTYGDTEHCDPVSLRPALRDYTVFIDGMSKAFAATGIRVGWTFGPEKIMDKMKTILGHIGAWAPRAEQLACARYLDRKREVDGYLVHIRNEIYARLSAFHKGFRELSDEGFPVMAISPQAAMYLTVKMDLKGWRKKNGTLITETQDITSFLLEEASLALVPFYAFGSPNDSVWYRLSVGTCTKEEIPEIITRLRSALQQLSR